MASSIGIIDDNDVNDNDDRRGSCRGGVEELQDQVWQ